MPIILSNPTATTSPVLEFDPAAQGTGTPLTVSSGNYGLVSFSCPSPGFRWQWAGTADSEGMSTVGGQPDNRQVQIGLEVTGDGPLYALQSKLGKLHREGGTLMYTTPAGDAITFDVLAHDEFAPLFDNLHYLGGVTQVTVSLTCAPYGRGAEIDLGDNVETTLPALVFSEAAVPGDAPALGRLVVDNDAPADWWSVRVGARRTLRMTSPSPPRRCSTKPRQ